MTITMHEIDRIARLGDPIVRNLQITHSYYEISRAIAVFVGSSANWCTFATWASKQAGITIRREDLRRRFETRFDASPEIGNLLAELQQKLRRMGAKLPVRMRRETILGELNPLAVFERAGDAVARGNKKVFEEIGREFARFGETFRDDDHFDREKTARFCAALRPGDPPDGQRLLSEAFAAYSAARFQRGKEQLELMLLGNICAGYHEQVRLQPEIAQALNATLGEPADLRRRLMNLVLPVFYLRARARVLQQRSTLLDNVFDRLIAEVNRLIRQVITDHLMTLHLPANEVLRLGNDLPGSFPQELQQIDNPRLREMLAHVDRTPENVDGSGARDWANFPDRMHFIADFFRLYQSRRELFDAPFTNEQVTSLKSGAIPSGRL